MEEYFSIGEMAKLNNTSVETLRHYDRFDILKPDYINEKTGYRYYSMKSFVKMDLIKKCKELGLSLDEIKEMIENYDSIDSVLKTIQNQKEIIDNKLKKLNKLYNKIENLENEIQKALDYGINKILVKHNNERKLIKYNFSGRYTKEFEMNLRKTMTELEKNDIEGDYQIVFESSYFDLVNEKKLNYTKTMLQINQTNKKNLQEIVTLPKGNYLTLYFDDSFYNTKKYYDKLLTYMNENHINAKSNFNETYIMTRVNKELEIKALAKIEILI